MNSDQKLKQNFSKLNANKAKGRSEECSTPKGMVSYVERPALTTRRKISCILAGDIQQRPSGISAQTLERNSKNVLPSIGEQYEM